MRIRIVCVCVICITMLLSACAANKPYNTQRGAVAGGIAGAIIGQIIGHDTESTLIGMTTGAVLGGLVGNAYDQQYAEMALREAAANNKRVVYYDNNGGAVEVIPISTSQSTKCTKVQKRTWKDGQLISNVIEEVCESQKTTDEY